MALNCQPMTPVFPSAVHPAAVYNPPNVLPFVKTPTTCRATPRRNTYTETVVHSTSPRRWQTTSTLGLPAGIGGVLHGLDSMAHLQPARLLSAMSRASVGRRRRRIWNQGVSKNLLLLLLRAVQFVSKIPLRPKQLIRSAAVALWWIRRCKWRGSAIRDHLLLIGAKLCCEFFICRLNHDGNMMMYFRRMDWIINMIPLLLEQIL